MTEHGTIGSENVKKAFMKIIDGYNPDVDGGVVAGLESFTKDFTYTTGDLFGLCMRDKNLQHAVMNNISFGEARFMSVDFGRSTLTNSGFFECKFSDCEFQDSNLENSIFSGSTGRCTLFSGAKLNNSIFSDADFHDSCFLDVEACGVDFSGANLMNTYFIGANLKYANLSYANLSRADLQNADLSWADLRGANLTGADLRGANLTGVNFDVETSGFLSVCPEKGSFIGYKEAQNIIVELLIPEDAKRSSATTRKCRCSKAMVLSLSYADGSEPSCKSVTSSYDKQFVYKVGSVVEVKDFDKNRWEECSTGIHFFITRDEAVAYCRV